MKQRAFRRRLLTLALSALMLLSLLPGAWAAEPVIDPEDEIPADTAKPDPADSRIDWQVTEDDALRFNRSFFKNFFDERTEGDAFRYVTFHTDASMDYAEIYTDYRGENQQKFDRDTLEDTDFYYSSQQYGAFPISALSFLPVTGSAGKTVTLRFTVCGREDRYSGVLAVEIIASSGSTGGTDSGAAPSGGGTDTGAAPSGGGTDTGANSSGGGTNTGAAPSGGGTDTGAAPSGNGTNTGANPSGGGADSSGTAPVDNPPAPPVDTAPAQNPPVYRGDIRYAVSNDAFVRVQAGDFSRFFRTQFPNGQLTSVRLLNAPDSGTLYYNYYNASPFGSPTRQELTAASLSDRVFYYSPASENLYSLAELCWFPQAGVNACAMVSFAATGTDSDSGGKEQTVEGTLLFSGTRSVISDVYGATPKNMAVSFPGSSIAASVNNAVGAFPAGVQFLSLPGPGVGTVYFDGTTPAAVGQVYTYPNGPQPIGSLRFVPASEYIGSVEIPYVALDNAGQAMGMGSFNLGIVSTLKRFKDVTSSTWCYKYVTELADAKILNGYYDGTFHPDATVTYGAALKLIMLAAGYPVIQPAVEGSPFSGYLARAKSDGFITRENVDLSAYATRLQVAQLAAGAMRIDTKHLSSVQPFTDTTSPSVQALNAAGIINGYYENGVSTFRPDGPVTRGQVAAIVWRMRNYQK